MKLLKKTSTLITLLKEHTKHNLYLVGGAVRDHFLGVDNDDIDIAIECNEDQLEELERKLKSQYYVMSTQFYKNFGVLMVQFSQLDGVGKTPGQKVELTMTRTEMYRGRNRNPIVKYANIEDDLKRRDFTCNAIAYDFQQGKFLDPFGGIGDLDRNLLQLIPGNEDRAFQDDPLRILRAFRFAQKFGLKFSPKLTKRIRENAPHLSWLSKERVHDELIKIASLKGFHHSCHKMMDMGVLHILFPRLNQLQFTYYTDGSRVRHKNMWTHTLTVVERIDAMTNDPLLKIAALLHDCGKPMTAKQHGETWTFHKHEAVGAAHVGKILPKLGFGKRETARIVNIVAMHQLPVQMSEAKDRGLRRFVNRAGKHMEDLLTLASCDYSTSNAVKQQACIKRIEDLRERIKQVQEQDDYVNFKLKIKGDRVAELLGVKPGPELGKMISFLEALVLDGVIDNDMHVLEQVVTHYKGTINGKSRSTQPKRAA